MLPRDGITFITVVLFSLPIRTANVSVDSCMREASQASRRSILAVTTRRLHAIRPLHLLRPRSSKFVWEDTLNWPRNTSTRPLLAAAANRPRAIIIPPWRTTPTRGDAVIIPTTGSRNMLPPSSPPPVYPSCHRKASSRSSQTPTRTRSRFRRPPASEGPPSFSFALIRH